VGFAGCNIPPLTAPCFGDEQIARDKKGDFVKNEKGDLVFGKTGLMSPVRERTDAGTEAMQLALRNAFVLLDGGPDASHRTFGCLYGVERYGDNPVAVVPANVSFASAVQKLFSALFIFLFGLAVRNMLRMK
jgi:hypothetical protein